MIVFIDQSFILWQKLRRCPYILTLQIPNVAKPQNSKSYKGTRLARLPSSQGEKAPIASAIHLQCQNLFSQEEVRSFRLRHGKDLRQSITGAVQGAPLHFSRWSGEWVNQLPQKPGAGRLSVKEGPRCRCANWLRWSWSDCLGTTFHAYRWNSASGVTMQVAKIAHISYSLQLPTPDMRVKFTNIRGVYSCVHVVWAWPRETE